ncbi:MAG: ABC transporter substrate-binding protein [Actinomycetota bacterium]
MRKLLAVLAVSALVFAACAEDDDGAEDQPTAGATTAASCEKDSLNLFEDGQLTIAASNPVFPPWFQGSVAGSDWKDPSPESGEGFESALAYALADELGFTEDEVVWVEEGFNKTYAPGPKDYDFSIQEISITPKRAEAVTFSDGYYNANQALIALDDGPLQDAETLEELQSAKLGAQIGTTGLTFIEEVIVPDDEAAVFDDTSAAKQALENGQIDGIVVDLPTAFFITAVEIPKAEVVGQFESTPDVVEEEQFGLTFEKDNPLVECVNQALTSLRDSGELQAIQDEWLSETVDVPVLG